MTRGGLANTRPRNTFSFTHFRFQLSCLIDITILRLFFCKYDPLFLKRCCSFSTVHMRLTELLTGQQAQDMILC